MAEAIKEAPVTARTDRPTFYQNLSRSPWGRWSVRILFYVALLAAWQVIFNLAIWPDFILPGPLEVFNTLVTGFQGNLFLQSILASLWRLVIGYGISLVCGVVLGLLIGRVWLLKETVGSIVLGFQALPSICWLPLAVLWFGLNDQAIIFVVIMGALFSITVGVETGVRNTPPIYLKAARNLGSQGISLYTQVILPAALPSVLSGLKQGWTFAWRSLLAGELLYTTVSLGNLLETGQNLLNSAQVVAVMLMIIVIGVAIDSLVFGPLERLTRSRWGLTG